MIAGSGMPMDAVVSDFEAGAAEMLSPDAAPDHWDVVEGQGSLFHPAYAAVSLGLLHGSQPDVIVVCHQPGRTHVLGHPDYALPTLEETIDLNLRLGRRTNPAIRCGGVSLNTSHLSDADARNLMAAESARLQLPVADPIRGGARVRAPGRSLPGSEEVMLRTTWRCAALAVLALASSISAAAPSTAASKREITSCRKRPAASSASQRGAWTARARGFRSNADERFPMASTFKVAVAGAILADVDAGRLKLDQMVAIERTAIVPSEVIADRFMHPGVSLSVANLLELMLTQSDNTATDVLTRLAGGPAAVTAWVKQQGVQGLRIDRDTAGILREFFDLPAGPFLDAITAAEKSDPKLGEMGSRPKPSFDDDPRDTSTPNAMAQLLTQIFSGRALSAASTTELIGMMERCRTGMARMRGKLPAGTVVADKTGTIGGSVNDVGVITLPAGQGQVVIAVFVKKSERRSSDVSPPSPRSRARYVTIISSAPAANDATIFLVSALSAARASRSRRS